MPRMQLLKLSPLQARILAAITTSMMILVVYYALTSPLLAYAADIDSFHAVDHNHERLLDAHFHVTERYTNLEINGLEYEPEFIAGFDRGIVGRADTASTALANNVPAVINIPLGTTVQYMFPNASLWGDFSPETPGLPSGARVVVPGSRSQKAASKAADEETEDASQVQSRTLYISVNTCLQPDADDSTSSAPPQLRLYVSTNANNSNPGPDQASDFPDQIMMEAVGGHVLYTMNATGDVYIGVSARNATGYSNVYSASIAASIDAPFHYFNSTTPNLYLIDSDASSALMETNNLTSATNGSVYEQWMDLSPPYVVFANLDSDPMMQGIKNSFCGLENYAKIAAMRNGGLTGQVEMSMTARGEGALPKEQFFFAGLNKSSTYMGILGMYGNSTDAGSGVVGGGGTVFEVMNFDTVSDDNCAVVYNLDFCTDVAYSVPANPNTFPDLAGLQAFYDNATQAQYKYFTYALQQTACETTSSAQYSLVRNCSDCEAAYKAWLCSVTIPRCTSFSSELSWLQPRNILQAFPNGTKLDQAEVDSFPTSAAYTQSRNPSIDTVVQPGPYKEVLPCQDLCYDLIQSCPAAMGFSCPSPGQIGFSTSYGLHPNGSKDQDGQVTCNYPGAAYHLNAGHFRTVPTVWFSLIAACVTAALML